MVKGRKPHTSQIMHDEYDQLLSMLRDMEASNASSNGADHHESMRQSGSLPPGVYIDPHGKVTDRFLDAVLQETTPRGADESFSSLNLERINSAPEMLDFGVHSPTSLHESVDAETHGTLGNAHYSANEHSYQDELTEDGEEEPLVDEQTLRYAHTKHSESHRDAHLRASSTQKDELNTAFHSASERAVTKPRHQVIAEQKATRSLRLRLQGQARTIQELERKLEEAAEDAHNKDEIISQLRRKVHHLDQQVSTQQAQPIIVSRTRRADDSTRQFHAHIEGLEKKLSEQRAANKRLQELLKNMRNHAEDLKIRSEAANVRVKGLEAALEDMRGVNQRIRREAKTSITLAEGEVQRLQHTNALNNQSETQVRLLRARILEFQESNTRLMNDRRSLQEEVAKLRRQLEIQQMLRPDTETAQERRITQTNRSSLREETKKRPVSADIGRTTKATTSPRRVNNDTAAAAVQDRYGPVSLNARQNYSRLEKLYNKVCKANQSPHIER